MRISNRQRVSSRGIEKIGLTEEEIEKVESEYRDIEGKGKRSGKAINYPDRIYRRVRQRPLLIIHLLKVDPGKGYKIEHEEPVVAWSISFPRTKLEENRVEYVVNTTWLRENYYDEVDEEEMGGDDD